MKIIYFILFSIIFINCSSNKFENTKSNSNKIDFFSSYAINDLKYGTKTTVVVTEKTRIMETNGLPNHETGEFPNSGNPNKISVQKLNYIIPLIPKYTGNAKWVREPGVAINGVKFEPETAERFECETGEIYRIEAFQDLVDLGLDSNNAHVQPTGAYHYHGLPVALITQINSETDLVHIGFAHDGFPIYYSKSNAYKPSYRLSSKLRTGEICSYHTPKTLINKDLNKSNPDGTFVSDWEFIEGLGQLDECNGTFINGIYSYFVTLEYPFIGRCLKGEFEEQRPKGPPPGNHQNDKRPPRPDMIRY